MFRFAINIGLMTSARYKIEPHPLPVSRVVAALNQAGLSVRIASIRKSNTENTYCAIVQDDMPFCSFSLRDRLTMLAQRLHQDCVACVPLINGTTLTHRDAGVLIGPHADAWGTFDPQFFLEPV